MSREQVTARVVFLQAWGVYNAGETAGFGAAQAARLVDGLHVARWASSSDGNLQAAIRDAQQADGALRKLRTDLKAARDSLLKAGRELEVARTAEADARVAAEGAEPERRGALEEDLERAARITRAAAAAVDGLNATVRAGEGQVEIATTKARAAAEGADRLGAAVRRTLEDVAVEAGGGDAGGGDAGGEVDGDGAPEGGAGDGDGGVLEIIRRRRRR